MLQVMDLLTTDFLYNAKKAVAVHSRQPAFKHLTALPLTCPHCKFVNEAANHFCTNCGYPTHPTGDKLLIYNLRNKQRHELEGKCETKIRHGRNALYLLAAIGLLGFAFFFSPQSGMVLRGVLLIITGVLTFGLARWSIHKPFTALLIGFLMIFTTYVVSAWSYVDDLFTSAIGVYTMGAQMVILFFLWQGLQAAYQADILEEESKL